MSHVNGIFGKKERENSNQQTIEAKDNDSISNSSSQNNQDLNENHPNYGEEDIIEYPFSRDGRDPSENPHISRERNVIRDFLFGGNKQERSQQAEVDDSILLRIQESFNKLQTQIDDQKKFMEKIAEKKPKQNGLFNRITTPKFPDTPKFKLDEPNGIKLVELHFPRQKFSGANGIKEISVLEFLRGMTRGQTNCGLSEEDFRVVLANRCTGQAAGLVNRWLDIKSSIESIYSQLYTTFNNEKDPIAAQKELFNYTIPVNLTFSEIKAEIETLASQACYLGQSKQQQKDMYDSYSITALQKCLPHNAARYITEALITLTQEKGGQPQFHELIEQVLCHIPIIDAEINHAKSLKNHQFAPKRVLFANTYKEKNTKEPTMPIQNASMRSQNFRKKYINAINRMESQIKDYEGEHFNTEESDYTSDDEQYPHVLAMKQRYDSKKGYMGKNNYNKRHESSHNNSRVSSGKKFCVMCRLYQHESINKCYSIKDDNLKQVLDPPSFGACKNCKEKLNNDFFHQERYCPLRPLMLQKYKEGLAKPYGFFKDYVEKLNNPKQD